MKLSDDQHMLIDTTRRFLEATMPMAQVRILHETEAGFETGWWEQATQLGWTALLPGPTGSDWVSEAPLVDLALVAEELGAVVAPGPFLADNVVMAALELGGVTTRVMEVVDGIRTGAVIATPCFKEPASSWSPDRVACAATETAAGYRISGSKTMVEHANEADELLVTARTADGTLVLALVPGTATGVDVRGLEPLDFVRRYGSVELRDVEVGLDSVVAVGDRAAAAVRRAGDIAVVLQCAEMVGAASKVFDLTVQYATERHSFGRPLSSYQALKHSFADMKLWVEASRATTYAAARASAAGAPDASKLASTAKTYVGDNLPEAVQACVQMHGAIGVTWEHDLHIFLRRVVVDRGIYGPPDHHRSLVATSASPETP